MEKIVCFIDGLNLYHSIDNLNKKLGKDVNYLKWLNLRSVAEAFLLKQTQQLVSIYNFTSYATHILDPYKRHQQYIKALNSVGVETIFGNFKDKDVWAHCCNQPGKRVIRTTKEEKESDVNMALHILHKAYEQEYDRAFIISRDSDIAPALRLVKKIFPEKNFSTIAPPHAGHSYEIMQASNQKFKLNISTIERCLFPEIIYDSSGNIIAQRPEKYKRPN